MRTAVGLVDQSSFAKFEITGPGALDLLQRVAGANLDVPAGKVVYTQLLNAARRDRGRRHHHPARRATGSTSSPAAASAGTT